MQNEMLSELHRKNPKYAPEAYAFVLDSLNFSLMRAKEHRHISGRELSLGFKELAIFSAESFFSRVKGLKRWEEKTSLQISS